MSSSVAIISPHHEGPRPSHDATNAAIEARSKAVPAQDAGTTTPPQQMRQDSFVATPQPQSLGPQDRQFRFEAPRGSSPSSKGHARSLSTHSSPGRPGTQGRPNRMSGEEERSVRTRLQQVEGGQAPFVPRRLSDVFDQHKSKGRDPTRGAHLNLLQESPTLFQAGLRKQTSGAPSEKREPGST